MADYDIIIKAQDKTGNTLNKVDKNLKKIEKSSGKHSVNLAELNLSLTQDPLS
jgi:hypothetical protein